MAEKAETGSKLLSVNVSLPRSVFHGGRRIETGIFKEPVRGRVRLRRLGLAGDGQADLINHGGADKAAYAYPAEHYSFWAEALERSDFTWGQFGENFTVEGLAEDSVHIGDIFRVGGALVEVSQPRVPCFKLGLRMGMPEFPKRFMESGRPGFYLRVLEEGEVGAGDRFERVETGPERMTVRAVFRLLYFEPDKVAGARKALCIPALSAGWRASFEEVVRKAAGP